MARDEFFADAKGALERRVGMRCSRSLPRFPIDRRRAARSATSGSAGAADGTTRNAAALLLTLVELGTLGTASLRATLARRECFAFVGVAMTEHFPPPSYSNSRGGQCLTIVDTEGHATGLSPPEAASGGVRVSTPQVDPSVE